MDYHSNNAHAQNLQQVYQQLGSSAEGLSDAQAAERLRQYGYNELRACFKRGARPLVQRQCDKLNEWGEDGIASIVPCGLAQGIIGSLYSCPDMIGGGNYLSFTEERIRNADRELFVRYAQIAALMPMMQFSAAPWRALDESSLAIVRECVALHRRYRDYILETAHRAASSGEPMLRYLEYEFPHEGLARVIDQFMLGDRLLVCPVLKSGARSRRISSALKTGRAPCRTRLCVPKL